MALDPAIMSKATQLKAHPFAELFPVIASPQLKELVASIKGDGLQSPIVKLGDLILDGRCRYSAC